MSHEFWEKALLHDVRHGVFDTMKAIMHDAEGTQLSGDDLDKLKDCLKIVTLLEPLEGSSSEDVPRAPNAVSVLK